MNRLELPSIPSLHDILSVLHSTNDVYYATSVLQYSAIFTVTGIIHSVESSLNKSTYACNTCHLILNTQYINSINSLNIDTSCPQCNTRVNLSNQLYTCVIKLFVPSIHHQLHVQLNDNILQYLLRDTTKQDRQLYEQSRGITQLRKLLHDKTIVIKCVVSTPHNQDMVIDRLTCQSISLDQS